jgi:hypothetical protein
MHPDRFFPRIFSRILLLFTLLCCACLVACGYAGSSSSASSVQATLTPVSAHQGTPTSVSTHQTTSTPASVHQGTLTVTVLASPACPGPQAVDRPCPPRPVAKLLVRIEQLDGSIVATATTDQTGHFTSTLAPGTYLLSVQHAAPSLIGKQQNTSVTIRDGQTTAVRLIVDSGLR